MGRSPRALPQGCSFHITLRCNSRAFLIQAPQRRDLLLAILHKAQTRFRFRLYGICLMANHLHLLLQPEVAADLPRLMHWFAWYSAMAFNRLLGRTGHFWEGRYYSSPIPPQDRQRVLNTLRYIHANPKAAGVRLGFRDPYSNYGHYETLKADGLSTWHPAFLALATTLEGCAQRYAAFCRHYQPKRKQPRRVSWGKRALEVLTGLFPSSASRPRPQIPGQLSLLAPCSVPASEPWGQELSEGLQVAYRFRAVNAQHRGAR